MRTAVLDLAKNQRQPWQRINIHFTNKNQIQENEAACQKGELDWSLTEKPLANRINVPRPLPPLLATIARARSRGPGNCHAWRPSTTLETERWELSSTSSARRPWPAPPSSPSVPRALTSEQDVRKQHSPHRDGSGNLGTRALSTTGRSRKRRAAANASGPPGPRGPARRSWPISAFYSPTVGYTAFYDTIPA